MIVRKTDEAMASSVSIVATARTPTVDLEKSGYSAFSAKVGRMKNVLTLALL